jgi:hypothetical protein
MIVLVNLLVFGRVGVALCVTLFDIALEASYLLIYVRNVLFDNKCEFLYGQSGSVLRFMTELEAHANLDGSVVKERFPFRHCKGSQSQSNGLSSRTYAAPTCPTSSSCC